MIAKIIGWVLVLLGVFFFIKPGFFREKLKKKIYKRARYYLFGIGLALSWYFIGIGIKFHGIIAKLIMVLGIIGTFKAVFFLKGKAYEKLVEFMSSKPDWVFRAIAVGYIGTGLLMIYGLKH